MSADQIWKILPKESAYIRNKKTKNKSTNFFARINSNVGKITLQKFTLNSWRENLKKKYTVKAARENNELLRRFCSTFSSSLQDPLNSIAVVSPKKAQLQPQPQTNFILTADSSNENGIYTSSVQRANKAEDIPPAPPPRNALSVPPSLPPVPSSLVPLPSRKLSPPEHRLLCLPYAPSQMQNFNLHEIQKKLLNVTSSSYYDRNSPSSGFYSCTSVSSASPSSPSIYEDKPPLLYAPFLQSVKSRRLNKPQPQTAIPVSVYAKPPPPPPPPLYSVPSVRTTEPPSYASSMAATFAAASHQKIVHHQSPIPSPKSSANEDDRRDSKVRNYSPQAFKFFMEQHIENVIKSHKQRIRRQIQLETEMKEMGLNADEKNQMRKMLYQKESNFIRLKRSKLDKSMFTKIQVIGMGAFGEVSLVRKNNSHQLYAMKTLRKADVLRRNQVAHVKAERDILAEADNDWVVKLYFSFQDANYLYFVMEYIPGGDLMSLLIKFGIFEEDLARFYVAELTCAVESVHKIGFIHRDIKPDNILIDRDGHIKLTDFGLCTGFRWTHNSKYYENGHSRQNSMEWSKSVDCKCVKLKLLERRRRREENQRCLAHSLVGTPNYIAPEVLLRTGYTQLCDWWSVGVVLYEMLIGYPPFRDDSPSRTQEKIINWRNTLKIPQNAKIAPEAADLILKLCTSPEQRLGKNADEVKRHPFLVTIDFGQDVRKLRPPYIPKIVHSTDTSNFDAVQSDDDSGEESCSSLDSDSSEERANGGGRATRPNNEFFAEFTFRRFFDDDRSIPFREKPNNVDDQESQNAIYV